MRQVLLLSEKCVEKKKTENLNILLEKCVKKFLTTKVSGKCVKKLFFFSRGFLVEMRKKKFEPFLWSVFGGVKNGQKWPFSANKKSKTDIYNYMS